MIFYVLVVNKKVVLIYFFFNATSHPLQQAWEGSGLKNYRKLPEGVDITEQEVLNNTIDQLGLTCAYRTVHPTSEDTFFSSTCETHPTMDNILDHKTVFIHFIILKYCIISFLPARKWNEKLIQWKLEFFLKNVGINTFNGLE